MKKVLIFVGLFGMGFFLAKVLEYVFEYYEIRWTRVEIKR